MGRRDVWLSLTPEPERELPAALAVLGESDVEAERRRVERLVVHGGNGAWLRYLRRALDLAEAGHRLARGIPRGYRWLADHLVRAACAVPVLTAEGANRVSPGTKRQRFSEALGECGEAAAVAEVVERLALVRGDETATVLAHADRAAALLHGLVRKHT